MAKTFLQKTGVSNIIETTEWLAENGGFCDCEILANVENLFDYLNPTKITSIPKKDIRKQKIKNLKTDFDFFIKEVPSPWSLIEITSENSKHYVFQIGKNNNCTVILQNCFSPIQIDNDKEWMNLWIDETGLNYNLENLTINRLQLGNYLTIIVKSKDWVPVKIWCINNEKPQWFLKMNTELNRHKGDIKELEKLLNSILL